MEYRPLTIYIGKKPCKCCKSCKVKESSSKKYFIDLTPELASMVLVFFCGVRIEEVERTKWEDIKMDAEKPIVAIEEPKVSSYRRINPIPANAVEWLKKCPKNLVTSHLGIMQRE